MLYYDMRELNTHQITCSYEEVLSGLLRHLKIRSCLNRIKTVRHDRRRQQKICNYDSEVEMNENTRAIGAKLKTFN